MYHLKFKIQYEMHHTIARGLFQVKWGKNYGSLGIIKESMSLVGGIIWVHYGYIWIHLCKKTHPCFIGLYRDILL